MKKCCNECLFTQNKVVSDERKDEILSKCSHDDNHFNCHKASGVVCAGFYNEVGTSQMIRIAERLKMLFYQPLPEAK